MHQKKEEKHGSALEKLKARSVRDLDKKPNLFSPGKNCYHRSKHRVSREPRGRRPTPNLDGIGGFPKEVTLKGGTERIILLPSRGLWEEIH